VCSSDLIIVLDVNIDDTTASHCQGAGHPL